MPLAGNIFLVSLGCPKNLVDSEVMLGLLRDEGYRSCRSPEEADLLLVNTCGFIQSAVEEGIEEILELAEIKKAHPEKIFVVTGCMVQRYGDELRRELPEVDLFLGTEGFHNITHEIKRFTGNSVPAVHLKEPVFLMDSRLPRALSTPAHRAYLKVTEGCANRCAYCLIPSLRGTLRSRPLTDLIVEAQRLQAAGIQELTLVAQDLTSFGLDFGRSGPRLPDLLQSLLAETAIPWLRLLYLYPQRVSDELLALMSSEPRIMPYLDVPMQHVSGAVLNNMRRPYGKETLIRLLERIRASIPNAAIRSTFMVGFPGETERDVAELEDFLLTQQLDHVGIFAYSNEEGCASYSYPDQCVEEVKKERRERLMELQADISAAKNREKIGTVEPVLVEGVSSQTELLLEGRTRYQAPEIDGCVYITAGQCNAGQIVDVRITEAHTYDLVGEIVED